MAHARNHEQRQRIRRRLTHRLVDPLEHDQAGVGRHQRIRPPVIHQQLSAAAEEPRKIRVASIEQPVVGSHRPLDILGTGSCGSPRPGLKTIFLMPSSDSPEGCGTADASPSELRSGIVAARVQDGAAPRSTIGDAIAFAVSTCGFVRQSARSSPAHATAAKSKRHRAGSSITPSFTPSARHRRPAPRVIIGYFSGGITAAGSRLTNTFSATRAAYRRI